MLEKTTDWKTLKAKIKNKFSKLSETDLDALDGHMERLQDKVQAVYMYSKKRAIHECKPFMIPQ